VPFFLSASFSAADSSPRLLILARPRVIMAMNVASGHMDVPRTHIHDR
jgi:hypothetical protein